MASLSRQELIETARQLAPTLAERAQECEATRRLPDQTIADFKRLGLLRTLVPTEYGGHGLGLESVIELSREIGQGCGSSGWCIAICTLHDHVASGFPEAALKTVYADGPDALICGVFRPTGFATPDKEGYRLSGSWDFASTSDHADFAILAALIADSPDSEPSGMGSFLIPRKDFEIEDNWHVSGLMGTGSKRVVVSNVRVENDFMVKTSLSQAITGDPDKTTRGRLADKIPGSSIATLGLVGVGLGIARGALTHFKGRLTTKLREATPKAADQQLAAQLRYARSSAEVDAAELMVLRDLGQMTEDANSGHTATPEQRARYRRDAAWCIQTCSKAVTRLGPAAGGHAIFLDDPMQRAQRDIQVVAAHVVSDWDAAAESYARTMLGLPCLDPLL